MSAHYPFSLPPLPYPYDALAPQLDRVTLQLHHDRLFGSYTDSLNSLLASWPPYHDWPLPQLILRWPELPPDIRQAVRIAAGGVLAHTFVFESMTRPGTTQPDELLLGAIRRSFGSVPGLLQTLKNTALQEPGSGYVWLAGDGGGTLFVCRTADQDTPLPYTSDPPLFSVQAHPHPHVRSVFPARPENGHSILFLRPAVNAGPQKTPEPT